MKHMLLSSLRIPIAPSPALPCLLANLCIAPENPLHPILYGVKIHEASVSASLSLFPKILLDRTRIRPGVFVSGVASLHGLAQVAIDILLDPYEFKGSISLSLDVNARRWQPVQLDIALAGGFSLKDPTANYFYTSVVLEVDVKTALCKFGSICRSLPAVVNKFLGAAKLKGKLTASSALREKTITVASVKPFQVILPKGFYLDISLNVFDALSARATFSMGFQTPDSSGISASGKPASLVALDPALASAPWILPSCSRPWSGRVARSKALPHASVHGRTSVQRRHSS